MALALGSGGTNSDFKGPTGESISDLTCVVNNEDEKALHF